MQLKSYLFCLSLFIFIGCTKSKDHAAICDSRLDALEQQYEQLRDSLNSVIVEQKALVVKLKGRNQAITDSIQHLPVVKNGPKIPPPIVKGDPIRPGD